MSNLTLVEVKNSVATITLNSPKNRNALSIALIQSIIASIKQVEADEKVRVVVLTGAGKGFCSGADLRAFQSSKSTRVGEHVYDLLLSHYKPMIEAIATSPKIFIAAINGAAAGAGCSLALACDFRVMAEDAYLLQAFIHIGLLPDAGSTFFLARQVGYSRALEIAVEGKPVDAKTAKSLGLANRVVPAASLLQAAQEWAEELAKKPLFALATTKKAMHFALTSSLPEVIEYEARLQQFAVETEDCVAGISGFLMGQRKKEFSGKQPTVPRGIYAKL